MNFPADVQTRRRRGPRDTKDHLISKRRVELDLTQAELAASIGVSQGTIANIEAGISASDVLARRLARRLRLSLTAVREVCNVRYTP